jgi:hypothetical protein
MARLSLCDGREHPVVSVTDNGRAGARCRMNRCLFRALDVFFAGAPSAKFCGVARRPPVRQSTAHLSLDGRARLFVRAHTASRLSHRLAVE